MNKTLLVLLGLFALTAMAAATEGFFDGSELEDLAALDDSHEDTWDHLDSDLDDFGSILDDTHGFNDMESFSEESIDTEDDATQAIVDSAKEENELEDVLHAAEALDIDTEGNAQAVMSHLQTSQQCQSGPALAQGTEAYGLAIQLWNAGHFREEFPDSEDFQAWAHSTHKGTRKTKICKELAEGLKLLKKQEKKAGGTAQPIPIKMNGKVPGAGANMPPAYVIPYPVAHPMAKAPSKPVIKKTLVKVHKKAKKLCKKAKKVIKKVPKCKKKKIVRCMKKKVVKCKKKKPCKKKVVHKCEAKAPLCKKPCKKALSPCVKKIHACHAHAKKVVHACKSGKMSKAWMLKKRAEIHKMLASFHTCWSKGIHQAVGRCPKGYVVQKGECVKSLPSATAFITTSKLCTSVLPCRANAVRLPKNGCKCKCMPGYKPHKGGCR